MEEPGNGGDLELGMFVEQHSATSADNQFAPLTIVDREKMRDGSSDHT